MIGIWRRSGRAEVHTAIFLATVFLVVSICACATWETQHKYSKQSDKFHSLPGKLAFSTLTFDCPRCDDSTPYRYLDGGGRQPCGSHGKANQLAQLHPDGTTTRQAGWQHGLSLERDDST